MLLTRTREGAVHSGFTCEGPELCLVITLVINFEPELSEEEEEPTKTPVIWNNYLSVSTGA